jgi:coenzyme Q-binding protein COQ10
LRHGLTRVLTYRPDQLFDLVGDVERYPDFIKWLTSLQVSNRRQVSDGVVDLDAEAKVKFSIINERFSTRVRLDRPALAIDVSLLSGPLRRLENHWRFRPHPKGAELAFEIDFEFGSRLLQGLLAANLDKAVKLLVASFERRAKALYG